MSNTPYELDPDHAAQDDLERNRANEYSGENPPEVPVENQEAQKQVVEESGQVPIQTTADAVKGGEGDHSWGGFEEKKRGHSAGSRVQKPAHVSQEDWDARPEWSRPLEDILHAGSAPALGLIDFAADAVGLVPWLKPIDEWWDKNSPRYNDPAVKLTRDASSIIIPSMYGGSLLVGKVRSATALSTIPSWGRTLGSVAAWTGVDTSVAMISSHSKTDANMAETLNNWLGWNIPWATRDGDSPDLRWKKNVFDAGFMSGGAELLGLTFSLAKRVKLFPRDEAANTLINAKKKSYTRYPDPGTAAVESHREARKAAQIDEMVDVLERDPTGSNGYNAFVNDLGEDGVGKAVVDLDVDPLMSKLDNARIQGNVGTTNGRAASVANEAFQRKLRRAINGNERAQQLDTLFDAISPNFDAVVPYAGKEIKITAEQMNRSIDNLTNALFSKNINFREFEAIVDDLKSTVFNSNAVLDEKTWIDYSKAFKNAYDTFLDPNQMRASAMLTQQTGDSIADIATAAVMLGDDVDLSRQYKMMFDKLNLLDTEMRANEFIFNTAQQYKKLIGTGNERAVISWINRQGETFDKYLKQIRLGNEDFTNTLWQIAKKDPAYFRPLKSVFAKTNGNVDQIHKMKVYAENKLGIIKKGIIDTNPEVSSVIIKGLHAARIHSLLSGLSAGRAAIGNSLLTTLKPISVFAGAKLTGNDEVFKRAMYTYGGIIENFNRGWKVMKQEWQFASNFPEEAMMRGRADLQISKMDKLEELEGLADIWRRDGEKGKVAIWNMAKGLTWYNNNKFVKYGTNALYAIDGFTNSFMASGMARARAYDEALHINRGAVDFDDLFNQKQRQLYNEAFDASGMLTDDAAKFASREIALNLDNKLVNSFERFLDYAPGARGVFLFPRTGANAFELGWSFNPVSNLGPAMTRARRTLSAVTGEAKAAALLEHGIDVADGNLDIAFETLRSEYIGRQIQGGALVMGVGVLALNSQITGSGPRDKAERARMMAMGWKPFSIKNPITGEWRSYQGIEPFSQLMGLTADIVYESHRVDESITEDALLKVAHAISMNVTGNTFISGFEPLAGLVSQDPHAWTKFFAQQTDMLIPYKGVRSVLNNVIEPQLKDVNNDYWSYMKNANKFLFGGDNELPNMVDIYTGRPIRYYEPLTRITNAILPVAKSNGGMEPWRQWLLSTGWDGLQKIRRNRFTQQPLSARDRQFVNNWIGKNGHLQAQIADLMVKDDGFWDKKLREYHKERGNLPQSDLPIRELIVHKELDRIHDRVFELALDDLERERKNYTEVGREIYNRKRELNQGNIQRAKQTNKKVQQLLKDTRNK